MIRLIRLLPALAVALAACSPAAPTSTAPAGGATTAPSGGAATTASEIKVGAVLPLTGSFNSSGGYFKQAYELATEEVNAAGGLDVGGKKLQINLKILDDASDVTKSRSLVEQLATQDKVNVLLGGYDTSLVQAQQGVPDQYKIPMVEGGGAASAIFTRGNKYLFGTLATIDDLGANTMDFLKYWMDQGKLPKPLKIALAWENTDHGKDYQAAVQKAAKDNSAYFQVVLDQSFDLNGSDFTPLLTQVKAANADAFLSDAHLPDFITMHRQYTQLGLKHKFVSYGARGPDQKGREALGPAADNLVAGLWWTPALTTPESQKFTETWKSRFNVTPDWFQALGYDTARVMYAGVTRAGSLEGDKIRDALAGLEFTGSLVPGGKISFDATGKPKTTYVMTQNLPDNQVQLVWPQSIEGYKPAIMPFPQPDNRLAMFSAGDIATLALASVLTAGLYAMMSYGLALVYGVMKIINLAHAGTMMLSAFVVLSLNRAFHLDPILGSIVSAPIFFVFGIVLYRLAVRRVVNAPPIASLLLLFGVWLCAQNLAYLVWGSEDQSIITAYTYTTLDVGGLKVAVTRLVPFIVSLAALGGLSWFLRSTDLGKAIRAVSQNATSARLVGIRAERVATIAFGLGTALSAFAGGLLTLIYSFNPDFGGVFQLKSFAIIVLGGLESLPGVALGALVLGIVESFSIVIPGWRASLINLLAFGLLVAALVLLPGGMASLLERRRRRA